MTGLCKDLFPGQHQELRLRHRGLISDNQPSDCGGVSTGSPQKDLELANGR